MKIEYKNTFEDWLNYEKLRSEKSKTLKIYKNFCLYVFIVACIYIYIKYVLYMKGVTFWLLSVYILLMIIACIKLTPKFDNILQKNIVKIKIKKFPQIIQEKTLEIDKDIIKIINNINKNSFIINKTNIKEIVKIENIIYLIPIKEKNPVYPIAIIPLTIFKDKKSKEEFLNLLNNFKDIKIKKL